MKELRPYQQSAIEAVSINLAKGIDKQLLCLATGLGKTFLSVKLVEQLGFKSVLWITHREELCNQSALAFIRDKFDESLSNYVDKIGFINYINEGGIFAGKDFKMGLIKASTFQPYGSVTVASIQTLHKRLSQLDPNQYDCIIVDECFPKGSLVDGTPIEKIKVGDFVRSYNHNTNKVEYKEVKRLFKKKVNCDLIRITLTNKTSFVCTENHPIYTKEFGYKDAKFISKHSCSLMINCLSLQNEILNKNTYSGMFNLQNGLCSKASSGKQDGLLLKKMQTTSFNKSGKNSYCNLLDLQKTRNIVWTKGIIKSEEWKKFSMFFRKLQERIFKNKNKELCNKNENKKSNVDGRSKRKNGFQNEGENLFRERRKWRTNETPANVIFSNRIGNGTSNRNSLCKRQISEPTELLQSRFSRPFCEISNRSGREDSQVEEMEIFRQEENGDFKCVRVANCEIYKRGSREFNEQMCEENYVYNIEVEDNHNYFVENTLVHNCHYGTTLLKKAVDYFSPRVRIGLSATPFRRDGVLMSDLFDEIVFNYGIAEGIKNGYLCEMDGIRVKTDISLDCVKTVAGELNQRELADEVNCYKRNKLIVNKYLEYAKGLQAIVFCVDISHCLDLLEVFKEMGVNAEAVSSDEERTGDRDLTIKRFKSRKIDVLINVEILTTGFDEPNVGCVIMACPTKSIVKYVQAVGRGTRLKDAEFVAKNGQKCVLLDIVDVTSKHSLINHWELDKGLPPEERVYITSENREKLIEARRVRIEGKHNKDERVQLLPILSPRFKTTIKSQELATQPQLDWLRALGYPVDEVAYTKENCREILGSLPAKKSDLEELRKLGYDTQQPITRNQASYTIWKHKNKQVKWNKQ